MRNSHRSAGFTLVEVLIASVLIVILLGAFLQLLASQARVASEETQDSTAQSGLIMTIEAMLPLLEEGTPRNTVLPRTIEFYVPMKGSDGTVSAPKVDINGSGRPELLLGAGEPGDDMVLGNYYQITFQEEVRDDQLIDEATLVRSNGFAGVDLNQDGDTTDQFKFGTLVLRQFTKADVQVGERYLGGRVAIELPSGVIFTKNGSMLDVKLLSLDIRTKAEESRIRTTLTKIKIRGQKGLTYDPTP